jgi:hypothetical protein
MERIDYHILAGRRQYIRIMDIPAVLLGGIIDIISVGFENVVILKRG